MTEQANTGVTEPQSSLTEEQIQEKVKAIQTAVASFMNDPRHERWKPCAANRDVLELYINAHKLDWTADSLHAAYEDLSKEGKLVLYEESKLKPEEPPKVKDKLPPIGQASGADLGAGLADQQRAKKTVEGVAPASSRDAFVKAAQKFQNRQVSGSPRLRLG